MFINLIDKQLEKLGYKIRECSVNSVEYEKEEPIGKYTHIICIHWKRHLNTFVVQSYEKDTNSDGYNNCVQLTMREVLLIYLRMVFM